MKKIIAVLMSISMLLALCACGHEHIWEEADCEHPKTCSECGETEGEALGHDWEEADCEQPKTCKRCGKTEGEALGHDWEEADCEQPKTCKRCGKTEGEVLGHDVEEWNILKEPSCSEEGEREGICKRCGKTVNEKIEKLPHELKDWIITEQATYDNPGTRVRECSVCGEVIESESYSLSGEEKLNAFKNEAGHFNYKDVARDPDIYKGQKFVLSGRVMQVINEDTVCRYLITLSGYDIVYVTYERPSGESRILEKDNVTIYGYSGDLYSYETVRGSKNTIPSIEAIIIELR